MKLVIKSSIKIFKKYVFIVVPADWGFKNLNLHPCQILHLKDWTWYFIHRCTVGNNLIDISKLTQIYVTKIIVYFRIWKVKQSYYRPAQALRFPGGWGSQSSKQSENEGNKVVSPRHLPPPRKYSWYSFLLEAEWTPGHSAAGRMSMKNSNDTLGNQTRDLSACSTVSKPTAPPRVPVFGYTAVVSII
jgi:hypothetical protein